MTASAMLRGLEFSSGPTERRIPICLPDGDATAVYREEGGRTYVHIEWPAAEPPPKHLCSVCFDTGIEWDDDGPQPCTNRIHEEVKDG